MRHPVVSFTYPTPNQIATLEEVLSSSEANIDSLYDRYVLFSHKDDALHHNCPMFEVLEQDIDKSPVRVTARKHYNKMVALYGQEVVNKFVIKDLDYLEKKILKLLNFAFDEVYQTNTIQVEFIKDLEYNVNYTSLPHFLYNLLGKHFDIVNQRLRKTPVEIVIKKRED